MGWRIDIKKDKYRIFSSISDSYSDWGTREECIECIAEKWMEDTKEKIEELKATFPNGWSTPDLKRISDNRYMNISEYAGKMLDEKYGNRKKE